LSWAQGGEAADGMRASTKGARRRRLRDVFVYFDNDAKVRAPADARNLEKKILAAKLARFARESAEAA